jgi:hypothetical protein
VYLLRQVRLRPTLRVKLTGETREVVPISTGLRSQARLRRAWPFLRLASIHTPSRAVKRILDGGFRANSEHGIGE